MASVALLGLPENRDRRIWLICDELPSLHKLPQLPESIAEARKYGGCFVLGMQSYAQLEKVYGKNNVKIITDEYGNTWNEISINQARDLANILLQRNEANQIIGQANIKAMTVLIDAINHKQDTLPH